MARDAGPSDPAPPPDIGPLRVADANRMLPMVRQALAAAQRHLAEMRAAHHEVAQLESVGRGPDGAHILAADRQAALRWLRDEQASCTRLIATLAARGCEVKDLGAGICDFPGMVGGQRVLLCWREGEPSVAHYHGLSAGFAGRRPIPPGTP